MTIEGVDRREGNSMRHLKPALMTAGLLAGLAAPPGTARAADCRVAPYSFQFGVDTSTQMTVKSGKTCGSNIRFGSGGGGSKIAASQPPSNDSVLTPTPTHWEYVSRRGFTGVDHFIIDVTGESMGRHVFTGTTHIDVAVTVTP